MSHRCHWHVCTQLCMDAMSFFLVCVVKSLIMYQYVQAIIRKENCNSLRSRILTLSFCYIGVVLSMFGGICFLCKFYKKYEEENEENALLWGSVPLVMEAFIKSGCTLMTF